MFVVMLSGLALLQNKSIISVVIYTSLVFLNDTKLKPLSISLTLCRLQNEQKVRLLYDGTGM